MSVSKISVILPVFNGEKHIRKAIESVLNQTLTDFELIIVNDGSTDGTSDIINEFNDDRITLINDNLNNLNKYYKGDCFDVVTVNPPYFPNILESKKNIDIHKTIARHYPKEDKDSNLFMIEAIKNGKGGVKFLKPLYVHNEDGTYKDEILKMFKN